MIRMTDKSSLNSIKSKKKLVKTMIFPSVNEMITNEILEYIFFTESFSFDVIIFFNMIFLNAKRYNHTNYLSHQRE